MSATFEFNPATDHADALITRLIQMLAPESLVVTPEDAGKRDARESFAPLKRLIKETKPVVLKRPILLDAQA